MPASVAEAGASFSKQAHASVRVGTGSAVAVITEAAAQTTAAAAAASLVAVADNAEAAVTALHLTALNALSVRRVRRWSLLCGDSQNRETTDSR